MSESKEIPVVNKTGMRISLREAHKIEGRISTLINNSIEITTKLDTYADVNYVQWVEDKQEELFSNISIMTKLIDSRLVLRRGVQEANEQSGINDSISERKRLLSQLSIFKNIAEEAKNQPPADPVSLERQCTNIREGQSNSYGRGDYIHVSLISADIAAEAKAKVKSIQKLIDETEDTLARKNTSTKITLPESFVDFLEKIEVL